MKARKILSLMLAAVMVVSLMVGTSLSTQAQGSVSFEYNAFPIAADISFEEVTLEIFATGATSYQWQEADSKDGTYTDVNGATAAKFTFEPTDEAWYRCKINGTVFSRAVQTIKCDEDFFNVEYESEWYSSDCYGRWYVGNGTMAYTLWLPGAYKELLMVDIDESEYTPEEWEMLERDLYIWSGYFFDVVGYYVCDEGEGWLNTSYGNRWGFGAEEDATPAANDGFFNDNVENVKFYFSPTDDRILYCEAKTKENMHSLAFGTDTMLGDYNITNYADSASLKAILKDGKLKQVQMVAAASLSEALSTDPAFVLKPITEGNRFWVGSYSQSSNEYGDYYDEDYYYGLGSGFAYDYNYGEEVEEGESSSNDSYTFTQLGDKEVVTEIREEDSALAISWLNMESGGTAKFQISIGTVAQTGAEISMTATSNSITIDDASDEYYYALYTSEGEEIVPWTNDVEDGKIVFSDLEPNTDYIILTISANDYDETADEQDIMLVQQKSIVTAINPLKPDSSTPTTEPKAESGKDTITVKNLNKDYSYALCDEFGIMISDGYKSADENGNVVFSGLESGTKYYLVAKTAENENSDAILIKTAGQVTNNTNGNENVCSAVLEGNLEELEEKIFSDEEISKIASGINAAVWLDVKEGNATADEKAKTEAALGNNKLGMYLDISLWKQFDGFEKQQVANTSGSVTISFKVPDELLNKDSAVTRTYKIIRVHNGVADVLDADFNSATSTVTFETDKFSSYALVYSDTAAGKIPETGDNFPVEFLFAGMLISGLCLAGFVLFGKKKREE